MTPEQAALVERETGIPAANLERRGFGALAVILCEATIEDVAAAAAKPALVDPARVDLVWLVCRRRLDMARWRASQ